MARAQHQLNWQTQPAQARAEWNNLRDELETLLDQVHEQQNQVSPRAFRPLPAASDDAESSSNDQRRRDALRSVHRAVQRFNEPEEASDMPAQSPERLQSAIEQIRASQNRSFQRAAVSVRRPDSAGPNPLTDLKAAIGEISERMSRFETLLEGRDRSSTMVEEIAQQMEQLTSVVEMLANSVGEQSHIKRIESQIARLAENVQSGPDLDIDTISERLEVLSQAFDHLSSLQADRQMPEIPDYSHHMQTLDSGVRMVSDRLRDMNFGAMETSVSKVSEKLDTMDFSSIEACVRSVYDRIDVLENNLTVPTPAIERLTRDLAEFTEAMRSSKGPMVSSTLVTRVDALNARLSEIEDGGQAVDGLKFDMEELRQAVASAIEPRFSAIETQLGSLSDQFGAPSPLDASHPLSGLEDQIKQLVERLDQTGQELTQLQTIYADVPQFPEMPDFTALADMVASRAQNALTETAMKQVPAGVAPVLKADDLDALEQRLSQLFEAQQTPAPPQDLSGVERSLKSVNSRLKGLEEMLSRADREQLVESAYVDNAMPSPTAEFDAEETDSGSDAIVDEFDGDALSKRRLHPGLGDQAADTDRPADASRDAMPRAPTDDTPLNAPAYPEPKAEAEREVGGSRVPVPSALQADDNEYGVVDNQPQDEADSNNEFDVGDAVENGPHFTALEAGPPPPPSSDFASDSAEIPEQRPGKTRTRRNDIAEAPASDTTEGTGNSRSTFIAAARRAAQQNNPDEITDAGAQSLFGRALSRFQQKRESSNADKPVPDTGTESDLAKADASIAEREPGVSVRSKIKVPRTDPVSVDMPVDELDDLAVRESLLSKYRRPILLGAAVLAVGLLTLNLVSHRLNAGNGATTGVSANAMGTASNDLANGADATPEAVSSPPLNGADDIPSEADFPVGSIGENTPEPQSDVRVIDPTPMAEMPAPLELASFTPELAMDTPARVGLPETLGPLGLRDAAENGDSRAQFEVAAIFAEGRAIAQDLEASARWYERSAAQGFAPAAYRLGNMYENGTGVEADLVKAQFWYEKAANYGNRMSMHNLASILAGGELGDQNFAEAAGWFERAAGLGLTDSQFNLGMLYARGLGVPQDLASSYKWFSIAAEAGDEDAVQARDDIARSLDAETVSRLQAELAAWSPQQLNIAANFAPIGTWDDAFDPGPKIENRDIILRVQAALNKLGYNIGTPDGLIGPKTHDAVRAFENATGMNESGEINPRLLAVLGSQPV